MGMPGVPEACGDHRVRHLEQHGLVDVGPECCPRIESHGWSPSFPQQQAHFVRAWSSGNPLKFRARLPQGAPATRNDTQLCQPPFGTSQYSTT